ncbi:TetR family transcriptional regulator [Nocardia cyriacigeorgica]|uniref:TetR family transcriptional regulator n=1 Tax=Nocardia cyriacigeorgica TaxID=135487 RepID=A0A6P1D9R6_9NOCA|nr:TetR/AcrR family transcriptional regulator C-terminal domain-containing protein [Nocardia cyriacigeorgica]NEW37758.1 TetR family transcriptional regulator [Nocardia cyriacigeorgica]NEW45640.1 TetR family transcriptional regulator [Nocardia cyriacigeorgica]NEW56140.1 TetR family transcriptional regulator [Nocardia cyriacigeorgica]
MPRETLTKEQVLRAAVEVLDEAGVAGLNVRRLGAQLGVASTAMYYYVKNKDELITLAADLVWNEIELPDPATTDWRSAAAVLAREVHEMIGRHFWLLAAMSTHVIYGPAKARFDECGLEVYEGAGFAGHDANRAAATVLMYVIGAAQGSAAERAWEARLRRDGGDVGSRRPDALAYVTEAAVQFPRLRARLDAPTPDAVEILPGSTGFEFGLQTVLDGLQARLAAAQE